MKWQIKQEDIMRNIFYGDILVSFTTTQMSKIKKVFHRDDQFVN